MRNPFGNNDFGMAEDWLRKFNSGYKNPIYKHIHRSIKQSDFLFDELLKNKPELGDVLNRADRFYGLKDTLKNLFTILYSPVLQKNNQDNISPEVLPMQKPLTDNLIKSSIFPELKRLCENKELPSFSATTSLAKDLEALSHEQSISDVAAKVKLIEVLKNQTEYLIALVRNEKDKAKRLELINRIFKKQSQIENLTAKAKEDTLKNATAFYKQVESALENAKDAAAQTSAVLRAFGDGDSEERATPVNEEALDKVRKNETLKQIAVLLGKYREILGDKRKNSFSYGLGEKYDITTGNDINLCLSSDLALLGTPETEVLFLKKYYQKGLLQYRKREPAKKGDGDIIVMIDESGSTVSISSWVKAFALALLDIAMHDNKKFALIHFANAEHIRIDRFEKGKFTLNDVLNSAEHFFGGGTDFETPLTKATELLKDGFEKADLLMVTDGKCSVSDTFAENFTKAKYENKMTMTGILLNEDESCGKSLKPFCDKIYQVGNMSTDEIAIDIISKRV